MKQFLAVYIGTQAQMSKWDAMSKSQQEEQMQKGLKAWGDWAEKYKKSIVEMGGPLGKTKRIDSNGVSDYKNALTGFTIVQAETAQAAAEMFIGHPHFSLFPGDSVEVVEVLPIPGR